MTTFEELDSYLMNEFSDDYWSDDAVLHARSLIERLEPDDWVTLGVMWTRRPLGWVRRCADALSRGNPDFAAPILVAMIESDNDELVVEAADSLSSLQMEARSPALSGSAVKRLKEVAENGTKLDKITVEQLLNKAGVQ
jgi:hypothetical protein